MLSTQVIIVATERQWIEVHRIRVLDSLTYNRISVFRNYRVLINVLD